jgi:nucleotide-binding universal stress UspA family protein
MFKHILVPTDGSNLSTGAVKTAARLAHQFSAQLTGLHVIPPYSAPMYEEGSGPVTRVAAREYKKAAQKRAQSVLDRVQEEADAARVSCDTRFVTSDTPWTAIVEMARELKCDLIVMASHGRRGLAGLLIGSETNKVLTHTKTPVLVCR